jgi:hypothetical protein
MARSQLRVYYGPQNDVCAAVSQAKESADVVHVPLGEVLPLLADAVRNERTWLRDFEDDESITAGLRPEAPADRDSDKPATRLAKARDRPPFFRSRRAAVLAACASGGPYGPWHLGQIGACRWAAGEIGLRCPGEGSIIVKPNESRPASWPAGSKALLECLRGSLA